MLLVYFPSYRKRKKEKCTDPSTLSSQTLPSHMPLGGRSRPSTSDLPGPLRGEQEGSRCRRSGLPSPVVCPDHMEAAINVHGLVAGTPAWEAAAASNLTPAWPVLAAAFQKALPEGGGRGSVCRSQTARGCSSRSRFV